MEFALAFINFMFSIVLYGYVLNSKQNLDQNLNVKDTAIVIGLVPVILILLGIAITSIVLGTLRLWGVRV